MVSPKYERFTLALDDDAIDFFPNDDDNPSSGSSDGFEEIVSATILQFARVESAIGTISEMWTGCYKYIASSFKSQNVKATNHITS
ncbi:uncharacterized protein L199_005557 [Kwoniella botswanensis]|uniref:uncharacterized protein n=1 Tax=Kwoniella botswanensis TaxID=1268659 RepID=UPI00315C9C82